MTVDAHFHIWQLDRPECQWPTASEAPIHRDHLLPEFLDLARAAGVSAAILVQSQDSEADTDWLLAQAADDPLIGAVVGWSNLLAPDAPSAVRRLSANPTLRGLRPMVQGLEDDWYDQPQLSAAATALADAGLRLDALIKVRHLPSLDRLAARFPALPMVIDHAAKPEIGTERGYARWYDAIAPLADRPNVRCKLSGLLTECPPGRAECEMLTTYASALLSLFGADRLMWGSDWPVLKLAGSYAAWLAMARTLIPPVAHDAVFDSTARSFYGLGAAA